MDVKELAAKTADLIEERGHCHGTYENAQGHVCVVGAARIALSGSTKMSSLPDDQITLVQDLAMALGFPGYVSLTQWNDEHDKRTVVRELRKVAAS